MRTDAGTPRPITFYGDPVLHRPCEPVTEFDDGLRAMVADMFASMAAAGGVGLSANQIGLGLRVFVIDCPDATGVHVVAHVVNPVLHLPAERHLLVEPEGCLSVPGQFADVARVATAVVTGTDRHGDEVCLEGTGLLARCLQHEVDHLDGLAYVDRLPTRQRQRILAACAEQYPTVRRRIQG
jgi:peptide deformylase